MELWRRIAERWLRAADPFFTVKMHVNQLAIQQIAHGVFPDAKDNEDFEAAQNDVADGMLHSNIHDRINEFARAIISEIESQKKMRSKQEEATSNIVSP